MDDITESIGQLSTHAKEWRPSSSGSTHSSSTQHHVVANSHSSAAPLPPPASPSQYQNPNNISAGAGAVRQQQPYEFQTHPPSSPILRRSPLSPLLQKQHASTSTGHSPSSYLRQAPPGRTEWQHQSQAPTLSHPNSPATASLSPSSSGGRRTVAVREFVPGSWKPTPPGQDNNSILGNYYDQQQQQQQASASWEQQEKGPTTLPSAATPRRSLYNLGISDQMWHHHRKLSIEANREMEPSDPRHKAVPPSFTLAYPLESLGMNTSSSGTSRSFGYPSSLFKVQSQQDGFLYCLRRFDNVRCISHKIASHITDQWKTAVNAYLHQHQQQNPYSRRRPSLLMDHPGLVRFDRCFLANRAVFFVHEYIPGARSLRDRVLNQQQQQHGTTPTPLAEADIWSIATQLVSAVRAVHSANLACRSLQWSRILVVDSPTNDYMEQQHQGLNYIPATTFGRVRIGCLGVVDALEFEARKPVSELQRNDLRDLGHVLLSLATATELNVHPNHDDPSTASILARYSVYLSQRFSREMHALIMTLLASNNNKNGGGSMPTGTGPATIFEVARCFFGHDRAFDELDATNLALDKTSASLASEYESGRALRLMLKLSFINERPEFGAANERWSEAGDAYVLKLFRDYVFHQADSAGRPVMDLGHVVTALNKLDAADEEKIVLASRDGKSIMVVSYADISRCLERAYSELCAGSVPPPDQHSTAQLYA